jgi:HlyD family secretion protein
VSHRARLALLLLAALASARTIADDARSDNSRPKSRTGEVAGGNLSATVSAVGTLEPEEVSEVGARVAGQVESLGPDPRDPNKSVDYTTSVEQGAVLAQIDPSVYKVRRDHARAVLATAEANVKLMASRLRVAQVEQQVVRKRLADKLATQEELDEVIARNDEAAARLPVARAAVEEARTALAAADLNLDFATIRSPIKGIVIDRRVNVGQSVSAAPNPTTLFLIAKDLKRLQVWASVKEADIPRIHPGQQARFTVDGYPGRTFQGTVRQVRLNAAMTQNVVTYTVVVDVDNSDGTLLPYLTANVNFLVAEH